MATIPRTPIEGRRFGLLADTHDNLVEWPEILEQIRNALGPVDGIIHCGDLCTRQALDDLSKIAPVWAVRSGADPAASHPELVDGPRILEAGEAQIGVVNSLSSDPIKAEVEPSLRFSHVRDSEVAAALFGSPVDACIFGGSHRTAIAMSGGTLFVNPGSPSLAEKKTVGILTIDQGTVSVEIVSVS
jgi:uncharacterized protein